MARSQTQPAASREAYQLLPVTDMSAGLDLRRAQTNLPPDRARQLVNFSLEEPGALVVRPGYTHFSTSSLGTGRAQGGERIYLNTAIPSVNSTAFTLLGWEGGVYFLTDSGGWTSTTPQLSGLSTSVDLVFPHDRDLVACFGDSTRPSKSTNGSSWTKMGLLAGTVASTLSSVSSGSLSSAEFEIGYTYKDRDLAHESNGSTALSTITLSSTGAISVQVPNSSETWVDAIVLYARNKTAQESIRRKASSAAMSTAASSTIVLTSSNWTSNDEEPSDHDVPVALAFGVVWKNRWWGRDYSRSNRIRFSQLFQPQSWPALFYIDIPFERGDAIRALVPVGDTLMVFGTTKIYVIIGQTSLDFEVRPTLDSQEGAFGPRSVCVVENGIIHAGAVGVYIFDGTTDRLLSHDLDPAWRDLIQNATIRDLERLAIVYHKHRKEVRIAGPRRFSTEIVGGNEVPTAAFGEWVLDLNRTRQENTPAWTETDRTIGGYISFDGPEAQAGDRGRLFSWHSSRAEIFEEATGTDADGSDMVAQYEGAGRNLGNIRGRWIDVYGEYQPSSGLFSVEAVIDGVSQGARTISIGSQLAQYGTAAYGTATYSANDRRKFHTFLPLGAAGRVYVQKGVYRGRDQFRWFTYTAGIVNEVRPRTWSE